MPSEAKAQLINLQQTLYQKAFKDAHALASGVSRSLLAYSQRFEKSLPNSFERTDLRELLKSIFASNIVLYGDFHTLRQSQRGLVRLLRAVHDKPIKGRTFALALEAFRADDQRHIDAYLRGTLDEAQFLRKTDYHKNWGFPWANFKMLFDTAREYGMAVLAINSEQSGRGSLRKRDDYAAKVLIERRRKHPQEVIFCLIGEHHLADEHLPKAIKMRADADSIPTKTLRVMSNIDRYFFDLPHDKPLITTEYLRLKPEVFCIMNSPPWMKWQSYIMWEELRGLSDFIGGSDNDDNDSEFDLYTEQTYDVDYHFLTISKNLVEFLGTRLTQGKLGKFSIYSNLFSEDEDQRLSMRDYSGNSSVERILERANIDGVYFISDSNVVLLNHLSLNNLSEASGQFIHHLLTNFSDTVGGEEEQFFRRIVKSSVGMAASKMLNPKRKCLTIENFHEFETLNRGKKLPEHQNAKRVCFRACLKFHDWMLQRTFDSPGQYVKLPKSLWQTDVALSYEISRSIGLLLGFHLYSGVMSNRIPGDWIKSLFCQPMESFEDIWQILIKWHRKFYAPRRS